MKVLLLGAGRAPTEADPPTLLAEQGGGLLVERFVSLCAGLDADLIFAVRQSHMRQFRLGDVIGLAAPGAAVVPIDGEPQGAACSALLCVDHIDPERELLILSCNELLDIDYAAPVERFRRGGFDAGVVTFPSLHPRYPYVRLDAAGLVEEAAERRPISRAALAGYHWFRRGRDFIDGAKGIIAKDAQVDGQFYVSLVLNELVLRQKRIGSFPIEAGRYRPLKTRRQVETYEAAELEAAS